jgi:hypothetical protein
MEGLVVKERPILFSELMVRALLNGCKTQTRRVIKPQPKAEQLNAGWVFDAYNGGESWNFWHGNKMCNVDGGRKGSCQWRCPYGKAGDRLWVRETWAQAWAKAGNLLTMKTVYLADGGADYFGKGPWNPSIHMPRHRSRLALEIVSIRAERLNSISEADAMVEGIRSFTKDGKVLKFWPCDPFNGPLKCDWQDLPLSASDAYPRLWDSINGPGAWAANPLVWVVEFQQPEKCKLPHEEGGKEQL